MTERTLYCAGCGTYPTRKGTLKALGVPPEAYVEFYDLGDRRSICARCVECLGVHNELREHVKMLTERLEDYEDGVREAMRGACGYPDEKHCSCYPVFKKAIERLQAMCSRMAKDLPGAKHRCPRCERLTVHVDQNGICYCSAAGCGWDGQKMIEGDLN